jgi:hypothetical protein
LLRGYAKNIFVAMSVKHNTYLYPSLDSQFAYTEISAVTSSRKSWAEYSSLALKMALVILALLQLLNLFYVIKIGTEYQYVIHVYRDQH